MVTRSISLAAVSRVSAALLCACASAPPAPPPVGQGDFTAVQRRAC